MRRGKDKEFPENGFEAWGGYMNAKIAKLEEQFEEQAASKEIKKSDLFAGISIFVNGYTKPSSGELKILMAEHGGIYHHYFSTSRTKFIIASNLPDTKVKNLPTTKIIKPEWITDSIKAETVLDYRDYLLYNNLTKTQPRLKFTKAPADVVAPEPTNKIIDIEESKNNARTAVDPKFLSEFYNNSRLHHISQLGAAFKEYVNQLRDNTDGNFPGRNLLIDQSESKTNFIPIKKTIMHIDMDCFFVSVGLRKYPHLRGKPVAVTHAKNSADHENRPTHGNVKKEFKLYRKRREAKSGQNVDAESNSDDDSTDDNYGSLSEIASCSYEARACGIRNGMFMGPAIKLCPDLKTIPYDFEAYKEVAYTLYDTIATYTLDIEAVSCDEMYVDCTELLNDCKLDPMEFATIVRKQIQEKTGCNCSTGFGSNRLQARMATKKAKPNGQYYLLKENVEEYFSSIALNDLPGVGRQLQRKLSGMGYKSCNCLRCVPLLELQKHFGSKTGKLLYQYCRGIDERPLNFTIIRKSISAGVNYGIRFEEFDQCEKFLKQLSEEVGQRMRHHSVKGKSITFKLMVRAEDAPVETAKFMGHGVCDNISKTSNLTQFTDDPNVILKEVLSLCKKMKVSVTEMRGINIQVSKLESSKDCKRGNLLNFIKSVNDPQPSTSTFNKEPQPMKLTEVERKLEETGPPKTAKTLGISKRRGRPPKHLASKKIITDSNTVKLDMFIDLKNKKSSSKIIQQTTVDEEFLDALPEDIRKEILESMKLNIVEKPKKGQQIDPEYLAALPEDIRQEIETNKEVFLNSEPVVLSSIRSEETTEDTLDDGSNITNLGWREMSKMLKDWLCSQSEPMEEDVEVIKSYMKNLVINKRISQVYYLMNLMHRELESSKTSCIWHEEYSNIVESVQNVMMMVYGHKLMLKSGFRCCLSNNTQF